MWIDNSLHPLFDEAISQIQSGGTFAIIDKLCRELSAVRDSAHLAAEIPEFRRTCQSHPIWQLLMEDPYTRRAFEKPRGYAGDAVMLDFVYSGPPPEGTSEIGNRVFDATTRLPNGQSVIWRRDYVARAIDEIASTVEQPVITSIACGHLRECQDSKAVCDGRVGTIYALDQDAESLKVVQAEQSKRSVVTMVGNVLEIISGEIPVPQSDFIYSMGLYDYLPDSLAERLTRILFASVKNGGTLLIGNFTTTSHGRGYMDGFMDWSLAYRKASSLLEFGEAESKRVFTDPHGNVAYLELKRF